MNRGEIRTQLANEIQDDSYTSDQLNDYIHQALLHTGGAVKIPTLKRLGSVTTQGGQAYAPLTGLTGGYGGRISRVLNYDLDIYVTLDSLADAYASISGNEAMDTAGAVEAVAIEGNNLWYQYIPAVAETINLIYYQNPSPLANDNSVPDYIPEEFHRSLLVNGAAYLIYNQIEDGEDDGKVNTKIHFDLSFNWDNKHSGINGFASWISRTRTNVGTSTWSA